MQGAWTRTWLRIAASLAACLIAFGASAAESSPIKVSVALGPAYGLGRAATTWAREIESRTSGTSKAKVFAGATLAGRDPRRELGALRASAADLAVGSSLYWCEELAALCVASLPWIAPSGPQLAALAGGTVAERLGTALAGAGVVALSIAPLMHRALAARTDGIHTPADVRGLRVQTARSLLLEDLYTTLGAQPSVQSGAAARESLAGGMLDAQDAPALALLATRAPASGLRYVTVWRAVGELAIFAASAASWDRWTPEEREVVRTAAETAARELAEAAAQDEEAAFDELRKAGATITRLLPAAQAGFAAAAEPMLVRWRERVGVALVQEAEGASRAAKP